MKMGYTGLAGTLILLLYFVKIELEKRGVKWGIPLDYAVLGTLIALILGFGFDIWKTFKDRKDSQSEHAGIKENDNNNQKLLSKDSDKLSSEHDRISSELSSKHDDLKSGQTSISQSTSEIRTTVSSIDKQLAVEQARREAMLESMTARQRDIHSQIDAIYALNQQIPKLEYEKQQLVEKLESLQHQYTDLERKHEDLLKDYQQLQQKEQEIHHEPDDDEDLTQSIDN
jgi:chromosome segregation ATPase